ncbi:CorA family divalent cation transporter [Aestuariivirga sp.]|uniref:CorA family divalent cation transporter n=1 Tax=Aestuariivirga sp. TaxID=2650926 RepID=UPI0039E3FF3A
MQDLRAMDVPGFLCAFLFENGAEPRALAEREVLGAQTGSGWLWLHLNLTDRRNARWLETKLGLPGGVTQAFADPPTRQFLGHMGGYLLGHMGDLRQDFDADSTEFAWLHVLMGPRVLVTGRTAAVQSAERLRRDLARGLAFAEPAQLLSALLANTPDTLDGVLHRLMDELELIEDHILDDRHRDERRRLMLVRRETAQLHRHMRALRRALSNGERALESFPAGLPAVTTRLSQLDQDFDALEQRARFFHDEIDAKLAAETNRQLYILSILTAAFLPPALVAGIFGMNVKDLPWSEESHGFWVVLGLCLLSSGIVWLLLWALNRR